MKPSFKENNMRKHYWTCSRFADYIRGTKQPKYGTGNEWTVWKKQAKAAHRFRYWLADDGLDIIQDVIYWPYDKLYDLRCYVRNRWIDQTYALVAHKNHIKRGQWCDVGNRFLPCLFDSLVDFVEIESAWMHVVFDKEEKAKLPFWKRINLFRFTGWRNSEAGIANLEWQASLTFGVNDGINPNHKLYGKPTYQAITAKEILNLYRWWKYVYANRPDAYDVSGWSVCCKKKRELTKDEDFMAFLDNENETKEMAKERDKAHKLLQKIEKQYEKEDTEMLIRLIKIRESLWT